MKVTTGEYFIFEGEEFTTSRSKVSTIYDPEAKFLLQEREHIVKIDCSPYHPHLYAYITLCGRLVIRNVKNVSNSKHH